MHWHIIGVDFKSVQSFVNVNLMPQTEKNIITRFLVVTLIRIFDKTDFIMV